MFRLQAASVLRLTEEWCNKIATLLAEQAFDSFSEATFVRFRDVSFRLTRLLSAPILKSLLASRRNGNDDGTLDIGALSINDKYIRSTPRWYALVWSASPRLGIPNVNMLTSGRSAE